MRHERQVLLEGWDQDALSNTRVAVVGCGSLGSTLAICLARLGIGSMTLIDPDTLEEHNLENQAYDIHDLGKPKVLALAHRVKAIDSSIEVRALQCRIQDVNPLLDVDFWLGGLDNVAARHYLNHVARSAGQPLIDAGIEGHRGVVLTIQPGRTACQACYPLLPQDERSASCGSMPVPSTYLVANATAVLQATQLLHLLHGRSVASHVNLDLQRMTLHETRLRPNPACDCCGGS